MVRTAWSVLGRWGGGEADDVVQEAFIAALTTSALPEGDLGAWLRAITVRKALDQMRRSTRRKEQPLPDPGEDSAQLPAADRPGTAVDALTVRAVLSRLSATDRAILVLADVEGRTIAEIASLLGLTRVAVKLRASRARRRLRGMLGNGPEGESR
jgi:RNA polymerase sigma-70 factor (ECF subfamily)